jgi:hypothetical protein
MGFWADTPVSPDAPPMPRGDSDPGLLVDADGQGPTLFGFSSQPVLRFGGHDPINVPEAKKRAEAQQREIDRRLNGEFIEDHIRL